MDTKANSTKRVFYKGADTPFEGSRQPTMSWNKGSKGSEDWSKTFQRDLRSQSPSVSVRRNQQIYEKPDVQVKLPPLHRHYPSEGVFAQGSSVNYGYNTTNTFRPQPANQSATLKEISAKPTTMRDRENGPDDFIPHHLKHKIRRTPMSESLSTMHIRKVEPSNDGALMTQAKLEKAKRTNISHRKTGSHLRMRAEYLKRVLLEFDHFLPTLRLGQTLKIQLVVNHQYCEFCCLERTVSVSKLIEQFLVVYHMKFEGEKMRTGEEGQQKLLQKLKHFLSTCTTHAFDMSTDSEDVFLQFKNLDQFQRDFSDAENFHRASGLECLLLNYLFLEYKVEPREESTVQTSPSLRSANSMELYSDREHRDREPSYPRSLAEVVEHAGSHVSEDTESTQKLSPAEAAAKNLQDRMQTLNELIQKSKGEIKLMRAGVNANGEFVYSSKFLNTINLCLQHKDILFDMDRKMFDEMAEIGIAAPDRGQLDDAEQQRPELFEGLLRMRELLSREIRFTGKALEKDLGLEDTRQDFLHYSEDTDDYAGGWGSSDEH